MLHTLRSGLVRAAAMVSFGVAASVSSAQFTFTTFPNSTGLNLVGNAAVTSGRIRVTPSSASQVGAAWYSTQQSIAYGFSTTFTFTITNLGGGGADGFAFVIQNTSATAIGDTAGGCELGYDGIANSIAVEFDTYQSGTCVAGNVNDPNANHISVHTKGTAANSAQEGVSIGLYSPSASLKSGTHTVQVSYTPGTLQVYFDSTLAITSQVNLATELNLNAGAGGGAWVGFTGATGGSYERHDITAWSFTPTAGPLTGDAARPATPTFTQPGTEWTVVNPADVDMALSAFSSPTGATAVSTDWEIWRCTDGLRVWHATAIPATVTGVDLTSGVFEGPYAGRTTLESSTNYTIKARYLDNSGAAASQNSYWGTRNLRSAPPSAVFPYTEKDVRTYPAPTWTIDGSGGGPVVLPTGASLLLGSAQNDLLARIDGTPTGNHTTNPGALPAAVSVRVSITAGTDPLSIAPSTITLRDAHCVQHFIYLPAILLNPGAQTLLWVDTSGSTYAAQAADTDAVFTTLLRGTLTPWAVRQPGYVVETFATNLQLPVNIAFLPSPGPNPSDLLCYITELYGQVVTVTRDGTVGVYASNLLNYPPTGIISGSGECGVAGIVIEPTTGDLFVDMLYAVTDGDPTNLRPKVVRMHSTDGGRTMSTQTTIITFPSEQQGQSHQISNLSFGPDGKLYVHMGDGMDATRGQTITSDRGKVLRMNLDGSAPTDNPFYSSAPGVTGTPTFATQLIWLYGLRNPFGGTWRASDSMHYTIENGPSNDRISMGVPGRNYLYTGSDASMNNFNALAISTTPLAAVWYPAHGPVNMAFAQTATFNGSGFPADKMDHAFCSESGPTYAAGPQTLGKRISEVVLTPGTGALVSGPTPLVEYIGNGQASCVGLAFGPDGLYFTDMYKDSSTVPMDRGSNLLRIRYVADGICPACPADFNNSGTLEVQDIFDYLNTWFAGGPGADFNGVDGISVQDIFDFLNSWFAGC